jgi:hypothetical protein
VGDEVNILKEEIWFSSLKSSKNLSQIKGNTIKKSDFLKFIVCYRSHCGPSTNKNTVTSLVMPNSKTLYSYIGTMVMKSVTF